MSEPTKVNSESEEGLAMFCLSIGRTKKNVALVVFG
jgi:hypothetical protein